MAAQKDDMASTYNPNDNAAVALKKQPRFRVMHPKMKNNKEKGKEDQMGSPMTLRPSHHGSLS